MVKLSFNQSFHSSSQSQPSSGLLPEKNADFACRHSTFAFNLLRASARLYNDGENLCLSPYSATVALAMACADAGGATKRQIAEVLHVSDLSTDDFNRLVEGVELSIAQYSQKVAVETDADLQYLSANSLWIDDTFDVHDAYIILCQQRFNAQVAVASFAEPKSVDSINDWVAQKTGNKIQDLLKLTDNLDALVLINALYFQGAWEHQFQTKLTKNKHFSCGDGTTKLVPMMSWAQPTAVPYFRNKLFESVALPYQSSSLSQILFKPILGQSLETVMEELSANQWSEWLTQYKIRTGFVSLPKFKIEAEISMNESLKTLGMIDAFGSANFSGISNSRLYISNVKQKTFLTVDERGSKAAAATAVIMSRSSPQTDFNFVADEPFLSILYDHDSGAILLITAAHSPGN